MCINIFMIIVESSSFPAVLSSIIIRLSWRILKTDVAKIPVSCERQRLDLLGDSLRRSGEFWIFSRIIAERCQPLWHLWISATLSVSWSLVTKRWIVLLSGTLFLPNPKSFGNFRCVRGTDFVAKYTSMIFTRCCGVERPL